jgi:hypothetical protein
MGTTFRIMRSLGLILCFISFSYSGFAQDKIWTGAVDSSWHTGGNWSPTGVPTSSQTVAMRNNTTPRPVISLNVTVRSVTINQWWSNPGDELKIRNNATLTITDDLTINGNGVLSIINGHVLMNATTSGQNNLDLNGSPLIDITNGSFTAGTSSEDVDAEIIGTVNVGNGTFTVFGEFDISNSDTFNAENGTVTINGPTTVNGTYNGDDGITNFNGEVEIRSGGVLNLDSGTINFNDESTIGNNGTVNFGSGTATFTDDITVSSSGFFNVQNADVTVTGSATFSSNGNMTVDAGSITIGGNASLSSGGTIDLNNGNLNVGGDASFTSGGTLNAGNSTITLEGDFTVQNNSNFSSDSSTVVFSGDSTQTVNTNSDITFFNVQVDSGAVFNTDGGAENNVTIEGNLTVDEDGAVEVENNDTIDVQGEINGGGADNVESPSPFAVSAVATNLTTVVVTFNKAMDETTTENTSNYSIQRISNASTLTVSSAVLNTAGNSRQVTLTVSTITEDVEYEITMNNIESDDGGDLSTNHKKRFTKIGTVTFYSRQSGNWATNSTWSRTSHSGPAATNNPSNTTNAVILVGDGDIVTVSTSATIVPQISVEVKASSTLRVGSGGTLTLGSKNITGAGTFQVTSGTLQIGSPNGIASSGASGNIRTATRIFGTSGSYTYNGSSAQITGNGLPSTVQNLGVSNASNVTLDNDLTVTGTLSLTNGSLVVPSSTNLIANTKSITNGQIRAEREITGTNGWRLLSSPIDTDYDDLFNGIVTQGYSGAFYSTGSNPGDTLQPNVLYYDESYPGTDNQRWRAPASASTSLTQGRGLYTYIFGSIAADSRYNNSLPTTLAAEGQEFEGPVDLSITYTTAADSGWNLVGNPYLATIDWDDAGSWTKTNMDNTIYIWDYTSNEYKTWNGTTGSHGNGKIAPFQGFWVKANAGSPQLEVNESAKTTGGTFVGKQQMPTAHPTFSIQVSDGNRRSSVHFMFSDDAKIGKDANDAYRLLPLPGIGNYLEIYTVTDDGEKFAINNLPRAFGRPIEIPVQLNAFEQGISVETPLNFEFLDLKNLPASWEITLIDTKFNEEFIIKNSAIIPFIHERNGTIAPNFKATSRSKLLTKANTDHTRFVVRIDPGADANGLPSTFSLHQNYPNPFNPSTTISFQLPVQSEVTLIIYDLLAREIAELVSAELPAGEHSVNWDASRVASGIYIYRLVSSEGISTKKMTLIK